MERTVKFRRITSRRIFGLPAFAAGATAVVLAAGGGVTYALTAASPTAPPSAAYGCVRLSDRALVGVYTVASNFHGCPSGEFAITIGARGATGPAGPAGPTGPAGPAGATGTGDPGTSVTSVTVNAAGDLIVTLSDGTTHNAGHVVGTAGSNGASAVISAQASTALTNWPDTGGAGDVWALDNWTRTLNVTVENQVNNSHCGGAAACYAVFGTITDTGTSVPKDGVAAPNNKQPGTVTAANIKTLTSGGTAEFQFYATSNKISASNVPASDDAATQGKLATTTNWGELAFPTGTQFFGVTLTAYDWTYSADVSYTSGGTAISCSQSWNDQINPGDDGQNATADGNITGICPVS